MTRRRRAISDRRVLDLPASGHQLQVFHSGDAWEVRIALPVSVPTVDEAIETAFDGLCLSVSTIRRAAITDAVGALKAAVKELQALQKPASE